MIRNDKKASIGFATYNSENYRQCQHFVWNMYFSHKNTWPTFSENNISNLKIKGSSVTDKYLIDDFDPDSLYMYAEQSIDDSEKQIIGCVRIIQRFDAAKECETERYLKELGHWPGELAFNSQPKLIEVCRLAIHPDFPAKQVLLHEFVKQLILWSIEQGVTGILAVSTFSKIQVFLTQLGFYEYREYAFKHTPLDPSAKVFLSPSYAFQQTLNIIEKNLHLLRMQRKHSVIHSLNAPH